MVQLSALMASTTGARHTLLYLLGLLRLLYSFPCYLISLTPTSLMCQPGRNMWLAHLNNKNNSLPRNKTNCFSFILRLKAHSVHFGSNWNLAVLVFEKEGKTGVPGEKPLGARREPTTNLTHILNFWRVMWSTSFLPM